MHIEVSVTARAPREKVFAAYTDFESMPKWAKLPGPVKVAKREGDTVYLESGETPGGETRGATRRLVLTPPGRVEWESEKRFTRTKRTVTFEETPEGTKVTATLDVRVKGLWAKVLSTRDSEQFEPPIREELASFVRYVEGLP